VAISIDNLINVALTKGTIDLAKFGLMVGGKGEHKPYIFTPADLFFLGEKGAYYSPGDISTLFQDAEGTILVTADGDPVGLMLDKSPNLNRAVIWTPFQFFKNSQMGAWYEALDKTTLFQNAEGTILVTADGDPVGLMLDKSPNLNIAVIWTPFHLFKNSQLGAWYEALDISTLFQDAAGTILVTADGDPVGRNNDKSGNGINIMQTISSRRPVYNVDPSRLSYDKVDDALIITVPTGGWIGTMVLATDQGTASYGVSIPAGAYNLGGIYFPGSAIVGVVFRDGALSAGEKADAEAYFVGNGAVASYGTLVDFANFWRLRSEITEFPLIDTSSGTSFYVTWADCTSLTSFPLIDTSSGTSFYSAWAGCSSLTSFPLIDTSSGANFNGAWYKCSSLTSFPLIDTSSGTNLNGAWRDCSSLTSFPLIDTSSGADFYAAWRDCSSLTSFPLIDTSSGTDFHYAWNNCTSLTSFPLIDTSSGTSFYVTWADCTSLTSFPLIDTSSGTDFSNAWAGCSSLTSFPLIDTSSGENFNGAWYKCSSLTSFPLIDTSSGTNFHYAWYNCSSLTSFPANAFDNIKGGNFGYAFSGTALDQTSIDGILVSLVTSGIAAGTRVFDQSGGSAPSVATGQPAIDTLRSRGWTVSVEGEY